MKKKNNEQNFTTLSEWHALSQHQKEIASHHMRDWFAKDQHRFTRFSLQSGGILLDYSRNRISEKTIQLLCQLAEAVDLQQKMQHLFNGHPVNFTEKRPALHTALRDKNKTAIFIEGQDIAIQIHLAKQKMREFVEKIHQGTWQGVTGKPIKYIVNLGIGGSHLGPIMATQALKDFATNACIAILFRASIILIYTMY